ncbi:rod shape-determining protein MreD [Lederbergia citrea]|uniref:Rod shape-determining protein MreD n=1 Tax=Lederbergia citrea TaxID=2833581 RepID=A0A942UKW6_9BACI|nr:rod shape-determining protein MreD [Lederbergia citrea]MBS4176197.1 rod shape-determining protein MreD [Lederbergia citrea]MBS4202757.1 rod shape-determining protein MreD [Lederbergia citrea]MBS4222575.1 rod shape-determining protein MreD [Lederbergia citrea]
MKRIVLPLLLTLAFYGESLFVDLLPPGTIVVDKVFIPHFLLVLLSMMGICYFRNRSLLYAAVFGLLFDIYYTEIIGVYLFLLPIAVYFAAKMSKILHANIFTVAIISSVCVALVETLVYGMNVLVMQITMTPNEFAMMRLLPTLVVNLVFLIIIYFPFSKMLQQRKKEELNE